MQILEKELHINQVRHSRADERPADRGGTTKTRRTVMILRSVWPFYII